ncbi:MAG TPA: hypothetical protein VIR82_09500 [Bradyrhizobium sp.]
MIGDRDREELEYLGQPDVLVQHEAWDEEKHRHAQEWLNEQRASLEREIGRQQLAVARDANEIARSAAYAASDAAATARAYAHTARAALVIAVIALFVSIMTPEKIAAYVSSKPWVSWFSE